MSGQIAALRERDNLNGPDQVSAPEKPMTLARRDNGMMAVDFA
jgi:hypothetical protein